MLRSAVLQIALLLALLSSPPPPEQKPARPDFDALRNAWVTALENHDLKASLALYDRDGTFINPDGTHVTGQDLRTLFKTVFETFRARIIMSPRTSDFSRAIAYESGSYDETITLIASGKRKHLTGDYVTIYRHAKNGPWLIVQQVWTEAPSK